MTDKYYTYAYLGDDNKPYYVGKGSGNRAYYKGPDEKIKVPESRDKILFLKKNLTEPDAYKHEGYMIAVLGRKHLGGLLENVHPGFGVKKPKKSEMVMGETERIFLQKKKELVKALELMADDISVEDYIDSLIEDIKSNFGPTPFEEFLSYYSVKDVVETKKAFDDSFLGNFDDIKIEFNINGTAIDYPNKKEIVKNLISNKIIWEKDGYYFREIEINPDHWTDSYKQIHEAFKGIFEKITDS